NAQKLKLPHILFLANLKGLSANSPSLGLTMSPMSATLALGGGPSMMGEGSQLDLEFNLDLPKIRQEIQQQELSTTISELFINVSARGLYPVLEVPFIRVAARASHVIAEGAQVPTVDVPFDFELSGDYRTNFERAGLRGGLDLAGLMRADASASCRSGCELVDGGFNLELASLEKLYALARPVLQRYGSLKDLPSVLTGTIRARGQAKGKIPNHKNINLDKLLASDE